MSFFADKETRPKRSRGFWEVPGGPSLAAGHALPYGLDPPVPLLGAGGRDPVRLVLALHHLAVSVCLAGFDPLAPAAGVVELQAELQGRAW